MILLVAAALAGNTTVGFGTGLDARLGKGAVFVGYGGGPWVAHRLDEHWDVHGDARLLLLAGATGLLRGGVGARVQRGSWSPGVGLDAAVFLGASLRAVTAEHPALAPDVAPVVQLRLDPLRFTWNHTTAEVLRLQVGAGVDRGELAPAVGVTVVEVGASW